MPFSQELIDQASDSCSSAIAALNAAITKLVTGISEETEYDEKAVCHLAWLTHQVIAIMGEVKRLDDNPPAQKRGAESLFR